MELISLPGYKIKGFKAKYCSEFTYEGKIWRVHRPLDSDDGWTFSHDGFIMCHLTPDLKPKAVAEFCEKVDALIKKIGREGFNDEVLSLCK